MLNNAVQNLPHSDPSVLRDKPTAKTACLLGLALLVPALALTWVSFKWRRLDDRANVAEAQLVSVQQELADHTRRAEELREVETSLREEMAQLSHLVDQVDVTAGTGVSRGTVAKRFEGLQLVNKDELAEDGSNHFALESLAGSIQLHGPPSNLTQIQFCGALQGTQAEASADMLATLLSTVAPQWDAAHRSSWLSNLANIDADMRVYKDIDRLRVHWHWTTREGVRLDVLSIEPK